MANAPIYQIAFMFVFNQNVTSEQVRVAIADGNAFLVKDGKAAQLQGYTSVATPPLLNFSISDQVMFINFEEGKTYSGAQGFAWTSFSPGSPQTLQLDVQFPMGLITATYNVIGASTGGQFVPGRNTIKIGQ